MKPSNRLGIFGGTFDPPHIAHLIMVAEAQSQFDLNTVLWVLTPDPPHKPDRQITPLEHRQEMVLRAIEGNLGFEFSFVDIHRPPPHYAADTMALLQERYAQDELCYMMGADSLVELHTWHDPMRFVSLCHWILVLPRQGVTVDLPRIEEKIPGVSPKVRFVQSPTIGISSSQIRQRIKMGLPFRYFLPEKVYDYIVTHQLYGFNPYGSNSSTG